MVEIEPEVAQGRNRTISALQTTLGVENRAHSNRVAVLAVAVGERLGMGPAELLHLRYAALLHDVGSTQLDRRLLHKTGPVSAKDLAALRAHALGTMRAIDQHEWLAPAAMMIVHHHERWDGGGYPDGLCEQEIPLGARIIAVAELFDLLVHPAPPKKALAPDAALGRLSKRVGAELDSEAVEALAAVQPLIQPIGGRIEENDQSAMAP